MNNKFGNEIARYTDLDYVNAREHNPVYLDASGSSFIDIGGAMAIFDDLEFTCESHLLRFSSDNDVQKVQSAAELVRVELDKLDCLAEDSEVSGTQKYVMTLLQCATNAVKGTSHSYEWKQNVEIARNVVGQSKSVRDNYMMSRVYGPRASNPDFILSKAGKQVIGPLGEVKLDRELSNKLDQHTRQAGLYGVSFLQRVFPMLPSRTVTSIFGEEWYVYVPLMSHKSIYMLRIDLFDIYKSGTITIWRSKRFSGAQMTHCLTSWVLWALRVYDQLQDVSLELNQPVAKYCWTPPHLLCRVFPQVNASKLVACPSFYDPIYIERGDKIDKNEGYVYKLHSGWTANPYPVQYDIITDSFLCNGWIEHDNVLKMPYYELGDLYHNPPRDFKKLLKVLNQVVSILIHLQRNQDSCHCDIRAPNICWKSGDDVTLIDYDLSRSIGSASPKEVNARDNAPDDLIHSNHDVWLLGVMILQLTCENFSWELIINHRTELKAQKARLIEEKIRNNQLAPVVLQWHTFDFSSVEWKADFVQHVNQLQFIIEKCLQHHNLRWQLDELNTHLSGLKGLQTTN
ncbi:hypothetical protein MIR68_009643 [Amoeboaphelidium protococcarum]|nr:hypothetical protein MIR68_009643 [Amoeboaphelidium protococcarum]